VITVVLGWFFDWMMLFTRWYDDVDKVPLPAKMVAFVQWAAPGSPERQAFARGALWWVNDAAEALPALVLGFGQVMVLLAVAVYAGQVTLYSLLYTGIVLLFGLVLFEDRDLA